MTLTSDADITVFIFQCREGEWLQAEGLLRKRRCQRGDPEPVGDQETESLQKPEPLEEVISPYGSTTVERPRKIPTTLGNKGVSLRSKVKVESEDGLVNVKMEEGGSVSRVKGEEEEIKVSKLNGIQVRADLAWQLFLR